MPPSTVAPAAGLPPAAPVPASAPPSAARTTLWSIQYLRAVAAFGVIVFHALSDTGYDFPFGAIGIHLFFVISGFLMWTTTADGGTGVTRFAVSRITRIVPPYWIVTALTLALSIPFDGFFWQATLDPVHVVKSLLFIPQIGVDGGIYPVVYQGWTLQFEMFFYALFALSLCAPARWRVGLLTAAIVGLCLYGFVRPHPADPVFATYTDPFCLEFLAGAWVGRISASHSIGPALALPATLAGMAALWFAYYREAALGAASSLATAGAAGLIIYGAVSLERGGRLPRLAWLKHAGEASYALYLFQELGFLAASRFADPWPIVPRTAAFVSLAVAAGLIGYRWIERPVQRLLRR